MPDSSFSSKGFWAVCACVRNAVYVTTRQINDEASPIRLLACRNKLLDLPAETSPLIFSAISATVEVVTKIAINREY